MKNITVYYEDNKMPTLEERVLEAARRYKAQVLSDFTYDNMAFQARIAFHNEGQINNFKQDLLIIWKSHNVKINIGGIV